MRTLKEKKVDDLIKMLDSFVANGGGHMNVEFNADSDAMNVDVVEVKKGLDCCGVNSACQVPTFHFEGEDDEL